MSDERPDALLKSALEKIVYFEARAEQLHRELDSTREQMERLKRELADTHQRELELRREVAELEVRVGRVQAERDELVRLNQALRGERLQMMDKLLDASRIRASGVERDDEDDDLGFDLASFISQLRSEVLLRNEAPAVALSGRGASVPWEPAGTSPEAEPPAAPDKAAPEPARSTEGLSPVAREAQRFMNAGRLSVSAEQLTELSTHTGFGGVTDETLFGFSVRELSATDAAARVRAAERLKALAHPAAAPALATALHAETDPGAQVALIQAFASLCREEGTSVVSPLLSSPVPEVRIAALKALLTLSPRDAAPHLAQAMKDQDRSVRRRASLLALGLEGETARRLGEEAIHDADPEARALAALALGAGSGENARTLLLGALGDREPRVRKAAAQSLSRILGQDVSSVVDLDETHRRREIRRLATLPVKPVRARLEQPRPVAAVAVQAVAPVQVQAVAPVQAHAAAQATAGAPSMAFAQARGAASSNAGVPVQARAAMPAGGTAPPMPAASASVPAEPPASSRRSPVQAALVAMGAVQSQQAAVSPPPAPSSQPRPAPARASASPLEALCSRLLSEVRMAVRGRSLAELTASLAAPPELAQEALALLSARGAVVRRGHKYFAA
ncbi:MAG TPA: HEAT repeat domain-containing protein [Myxococcus sp.]|nr:HEAT repeat domain-containing protein [Myxococcus sp.]